MTDRISMHFVRPNGFALLPSSSYEFKPSSRRLLRWVQKLCWRLLMKSKALTQHLCRELVYTTVHIDPQIVSAEIVERCQRQLQALNFRAKRVLVGPKQMAELMRDTRAQEQIFNVPARFRLDQAYTDGRQIFGLDVEVVPHMDGILVL